MFSYNTTVSSSTGVTPHYAMFGREATLSVDWVFPSYVWERSNATCRLGDSYTLRGEKNTVSVDERHTGRKTMCFQEHERSARRKSKAEHSDVRADCLVWYFDPRIIPGTSHKLRSFWAGPYRISRLIAPALAEIKLVYYPREEKLVSLDVLKLYRGEDVIGQDPDR